MSEQLSLSLLYMADNNQLSHGLLQQPIAAKAKTVLHCSAKNVVFLLLAVIFFSYRLLFHDSLDDECIIDSIHTVTQPLNSELHKSEWFAYWFIVLAQIFIDAELVLLIVFCSLRVENFFAQVWLALFYAFRGILLNIEKLPYPEGIFWEDPGFPPSIGVPYGIARDFFYSGHTGFMLFCCIYWGRLKLPVLAWFSRLGLVFVILVLLATRVHYIIDVVAAVIFSLQIDRFLLVHSHWFDKLFTVIYNLFMVGANKVRQLWQ